MDGSRWEYFFKISSKVLILLQNMLLTILILDTGQLLPKVPQIFDGHH